jgi:hypothetical protein
MIIWEGKGWLVLVVMILSAVLLIPFDEALKSHSFDTGMFEMALIMALSALGSLGLGMWFEQVDRKADPELTSESAQKMHSFFVLTLTQWGYVCLGLAAICLVSSGVLDRLF